MSEIAGAIGASLTAGWRLMVRLLVKAGSLTVR
jgi:hypothetical protein